MKELLATMANNSSGKMGCSDINVDNQVISVDMDDKMMMEISATGGTSVHGLENPTIICAPLNGPVVLPFKVKGVSILASLSTNSFVTVVPSSIGDTFRLKTNPMASSQFLSILGCNVSVCAVVDEFTFFLGSIEICLNNTIVLTHESDLQISVQLVIDFLESAAWMRCSTRFADKTFVITDGGYTKTMFMEDQPDEI